MSADTTPTAGRKLPQFHYPVPPSHTGKLQYRIDRAEFVSVERIGDVGRGGVIAVKNVNLARGLLAGGQFANAPADAPLGQPEAFRPKTRDELAAEARAEESSIVAEPLTDSERRQSNPGGTASDPLGEVLRRVEANNAAGAPSTDSDMSALLSEAVKSSPEADPTARETRK